jgi:hypothetical protein
MGISISKDEEKKIVDHFVAIIDNVIANRSLLDDVKLPEYWKRYEGDWSSKKNKSFPFIGSADVHVPFTTWASDAIDSRKYSSVFSSKLIFRALGTTKESREAAPRITSFVNHYMKKKMKVAVPYSDWFLGSVVEGQRFLKTISEKVITIKEYFKTRKNEDGKIIGMLKDFANIATGVFVSEKKRTEKQKIISTDVATGDFIWWPSSADSIQGATGVAQRLYLTKYEIKKRVKTQGYIGKNIDRLKSPSGDDTKTKTQGNFEKKEGIESSTAFEAVDVFKPFEIWSQYKFDNQEEDEYTFVIDIKNRVLLAANYNTNRDKRRPYVLNYHRKIPKRMIGQGMPRRLALMNDEMDTLHNIIIDNSILCNTFNFMYVEGKSQYLENWKLKPGGGIPVDSLEGTIKQLILGNPNLSLQQQESFVLSLLERLALVSDYNMGRESSQTTRPTARGTAMILHEFSVNFSKIAFNCQEAVREHVLQVMEILYEILPETTEYYPNSDSEDSAVFSRTDLEYIDDLEIVVLSDAVSASKQLQINNAGAIMDSLGQDQTGEINTLEVKKNFVNQIDRNVTDDIIRSSKEIQQLQQAQQQLQQHARMLRQKEMELEEKEMIIQMKASGATDDEIKAEVTKWRTQEILEEQKEN